MWKNPFISPVAGKRNLLRKNIYVLSPLCSFLVFPCTYSWSMNCKKVVSLFIKVFSSRNLFLVNMDTIRTWKAWISNRRLSWLVFHPLKWICVISVSEYEVRVNIRYLIFTDLIITRQTWRMNWRLCFLAFMELVLIGSIIVERIQDYYCIVNFSYVF